MAKEDEVVGALIEKLKDPELPRDVFMDLTHRIRILQDLFQK